MQNMIKNENELLIEIIREALKPSGKINFPDGLDIIELGKMIRRQYLELLVYPVLSKQMDEKCLELAKNMESRYHNLLYKAVVQENEIENLLHSMEKENIYAMPLKGWVIRQYYPEPSMRIMTDFDILIRNMDEQKMSRFMEEREYKLKYISPSSHDVYEKKDVTVVELHRFLSSPKIEDQKPKIHQWLTEVWSRCLKTNGRETLYEFTKEDFYIYHIIHYYKHFWSTCAGIRPIVDVYLFLRAERDKLDWKYLESVLTELELKEFETFIRKFSFASFEERKEPYTDVQKEFLDMVMSGGLFGSQKLSADIKLVGKAKETYEKSKFTALMQATFPSVKMLRGRYLVLNKHPWMLPIVWVIRAFRIAFCEFYKIPKFFRGSTKESFEKTRDIFRNAEIKW